MLRICQNGCTSNGQTGWVADCAREPNSIFERFCASAFSLYPVIPLHYLDSILCSNNNLRANRERVLFCPARLSQDQGGQQSDQGPVLIETVCSSPNSVDHRALSWWPLIPSCTTRQILGDKTTFGELSMQCKCKRSASVGAGDTVISNETFETGPKLKLNHTGSGRRRRHETARHRQETVSAPIPKKLMDCFDHSRA